MPTLPAAISRSAMTVGLSRSGSTSGADARGDLPCAVGRRERELEAVGNPVEAVFDRDAGHGESFDDSSSGLEQSLQQRVRAGRSCRVARQARGAHDRAQVVDGRRKVLIDNNIIEFAAVPHLFARGLEPARDDPGRVLARAFPAAPSATASDGGRMKMWTASGISRRTCAAPCQSISSSTSLPGGDLARRARFATSHTSCRGRRRARGTRLRLCARGSAARRRNGSGRRRCSPGRGGRVV